MEREKKKKKEREEESERYRDIGYDKDYRIHFLIRKTTKMLKKETI